MKILDTLPIAAYAKNAVSILTLLKLNILSSPTSFHTKLVEEPNKMLGEANKM
jgi:hypothetical protein